MSKVMKSVSLCVLSVQTATHVIVTRYSRSHGSDKPYLPSTAVTLVEIFKLIISVAVLFWEKDFKLGQTIRAIKNDVIFKPKETFKLIVPAGLYVIQNNLLFLALSNLDSATYQVCYQTKILTTAVFSVLLLRKKLRVNQWVALVILTIGVALVQLVKSGDNSSSSKGGEEDNSFVVGMLAIVAAACTSGFSGVYFEKVLKGSNQSLWIRNIQLAGFSVLIGIGSVVISDLDKVVEDGFFQGYTHATWAVIALGVASGLTVALVVKYADNILKGFAVSISILISAFVSYYFLDDFEPSVSFMFGASLVMFATFLYGMDFTKKVQKS